MPPEFIINEIGLAIARPISLERHAGNVALVLESGPARTLAFLLDSPVSNQ